jgi:phosphoesterase RecJ-like protein
LKETYKENLTAEVANAFLTGMIAGTNSFRDGIIRPSTLTAASELVHLGADRENIIKYLYQTKSIATFRLWGAALSHLQYDPTIGLAWSTITREDFVRSGAQEHELHAIVDELIATAPAAKLILLLHEHTEKSDTIEIHGLLRTENTFDATELLALYHAKGNKSNSSCIINDSRTLHEVEESIVAHLRQQLQKN